MLCPVIQVRGNDNDFLKQVGKEYSFNWKFLRINTVFRFGIYFKGHGKKKNIKQAKSDIIFPSS